ncbi:propionate kinase [Marinomonas sp. S3726]|uniref:acetate/propionate family kinase n=1 Tax=Marinomonas sp. S3726 TaxID=579484 RepID=UPI0005F9ADB4|nr:acetate kinase [Marinomonas sp. S3726]KJZ12885.1 propionate kinase [Marinomonas sp. S3726]
MNDFILVINSGSSSLKFAVLSQKGEQVILEGIAERLGSESASIDFEYNQEKESVAIRLGSHQDALTSIKSWLDQHPQITEKLIGIGHRVVHGGESFSQSVLIDEKTMNAIEACSNLAPLHNPANVKGIKACADLFSHLPQVAVFDTAFHQSLKQEQYLYPIPMHFYRDLTLRKYGFHGTSYRYISQTLAQVETQSLHQGVIVAHLGNGASVCAIQDGESVDTSMGLTPLDGLMMGTRSGSIDPMILSFIAESEEKSLEQSLEVLNKESGLLGISELSNDCRTLEEAMKAGDERAKLALDMFCVRTAKSIAALATSLNSFDHLVFTGGIGENSVYVRQNVCQSLSLFGIEIDRQTNIDLPRKQIQKISKTENNKTVWVIPTNEELMIALDTIHLIQA